MTFGRTLQELTRLCGVKRCNLADALGYDPSYISRWINGVKHPSLRSNDALPAQIAAYLDLGRVENAHGNHVAEFACLSVVAEVAFALSDGVHHDARFIAGIGDDLTQRLFHGAQNDADTSVLFVIVALDVLDGEFGADERDAAARDDAFFNGSASGVQSVFHAVFLFLHFGFGSRTDMNHSDAAHQLGEAFLQLFAVVIGSGFFDLGADLLHAGNS